MVLLVSESRTCIDVLILDDDEQVAEVMREVLELRMHAVRVVHDLEAAWQAITVSAPDVFVSDYRIGVARSDALLARVHLQFPRIRCVLVSGSGSTEWAHLLERGLVKAALVKPLNAIELVSIVEG
jgi:two-component system response regulator YesN